MKKIIFIIFIVSFFFLTCKKDAQQTKIQNLISSDSLVIKTLGYQIQNDSSIMLFGKIELLKGYQIEKRGFIISENAIYDTASSGAILYFSSNLTDSFNKIIIGLDPTKNYHYLAFVKTTNGLYQYGDDSVFSTNTKTIVSIESNIQNGANSFLLNCKVTSLNNINVIEQGIVYSTTNQNPNGSDRKVISNTLNSNYSINFNLLSTDSIYYVKAYAKSNNGTGLSEMKIIKLLPSLSIDSIDYYHKNNSTFYIRSDDTISNRVYCSILINPTNITNAGVVYSNLNQNPTIADSIEYTDQIQNNYSVDLVKLSSGEKYYVRAFFIIGGVAYYSNVTQYLAPYNSRAAHYDFKKGVYNKIILKDHLLYGGKSFRLYNYCILPQGIKMYVRIDDYTIGNCSGCNFNIGDSILVDSNNPFGFYSNYLTHTGYEDVTFTLYLSGIANEDYYYCHYTDWANTTNTSYWIDYKSLTSSKCKSQ